MQRNLLVTGGAGFIGANFVHYWLNRHPDDRICVVDALTYAGNPANLADFFNDPRFELVHKDIGETDAMTALLADRKIDTLVHFAAESHVDRSIHGPDAFLTANILGTHSLLKAAKSVWLDAASPVPHRFHHVSTDEVYGTLGPADPPFTESTAYAPNSPYAASKAASDHLVRAYHHTYGLEVTTSNCSNNYGPYHFPEKLIPLMITNILQERPLPVYGDGQQVRDWLYVEDHCRGIEKVLEQGRIGETYNIGGDNERTNLDIVTTLCRMLDAAFAADPALSRAYPHARSAIRGDSASLIKHVADRPGHDRRYAIDPGKSRRELGYQPRETFASGLQKTLDWYLGHPDWWRSVQDGSYADWISQHYGNL